MESSSSPQMTLVHDCESGQSLSWPARQAQDEQTHPELLQSLHGVSARSEGVGAGPATPSQLQGPRGHTEALGRSVCCLSVFTTVPGFPGTLVGGGAVEAPEARSPPGAPQTARPARPRGVP